MYARPGHKSNHSCCRLTPSSHCQPGSSHSSASVCAGSLQQHRSDPGRWEPPQHAGCTFTSPMQRLQQQPCCQTCAFTAGVVGALALVALLAAAFVFYKRNKSSKEDGFKTIARELLARGHVHWSPCRTRTLLRPSSPSISPSGAPQPCTPPALMSRAGRPRRCSATCAGLRRPLGGWSRR
jgi:hypothetical protein